MVFSLCFVCDKLKILRLCGLQLITTNKVGDLNHLTTTAVNKFTQTQTTNDIEGDVTSLDKSDIHSGLADGDVVGHPEQDGRSLGTVTRSQGPEDSSSSIGDPTDLSLDEDRVQENNNNNNTTPSQKPSGFIGHFGGIGLALLASLLSSSNLIMVKTLQKVGIGAAEATVFGYAGPFIPSIPLCVYFECVKNRPRKKKKKKKGRKSENYQVDPDDPEEAGGGDSMENNCGVQKSIFDAVWPWTISEKRLNTLGLVIQAFFGAGAILFRFCALKLITVGDTAVICISSPLIVTILAHFLLHEKTGVVPILMAILALLGVSIISRPPILTGKESFDAQTLIGTAFAFGSMSCAALQTIICRKIRGIHFAFQTLVSGTIGMGVPLMVALSVNGGTFNFPTHWQHIVMAMAVAFNGFGVICGMLVALKLETAGIVCLVRSCDVLFGFIFQFIFFGVSPDIYSFVGGLLIILGVLVMAFRKYLESVTIFSRASAATDEPEA